MTPYVSIDKGVVVIRDLGTPDNQEVTRFDLGEEDWDTKLREWVVDSQLFSFRVSSSFDWPEENGAPTDFIERWQEALAEASRQVYGDPDFPCKDCGQRVGEDAIAAMKKVSERKPKLKKPAKPKLCLPCLWKHLEAL